MGATVIRFSDPESDGERKAIAFLRDHLPEDYILLHNLEIRTSSGEIFEYDVIILGQWAVYAVDEKSWGGLIQVRKDKWFLPSGEIRDSPVPQINKKARVLKGQFVKRNRRLRQVWVEGVVLLSARDVQLTPSGDHGNDALLDRDCQSDCLAGTVLRLCDSISFFTEPHALPRGRDISDLRRDIERALGAAPRSRLPLVGSYRLVKAITKEETYELWLARHQIMSEQWRLLKIYHMDIYQPDLLRQDQERLILRDAKALQRLQSHPSIVACDLPFVWDTDKIVLPMEWIDGYSLQSVLNSATNVSFPFAERMAILVDLAAGLQHAHFHGVLHRNLCPENILITPEGRAKLIHFDFARTEGSKTIAMSLDGRLNNAYVAPEVRHNPAAASVQSDIFSFGAICYELLTLAQPDLSRRRTLRLPPGLFAVLSSRVANRVEAVLQCMCAPMPQDRYGSIEEALTQLSRSGLTLASHHREG